jgi:hypothetical protein
MNTTLKNVKCFECGEQATELAHVVPKSRGGTKTVPLCGKCHGLSHDIKRPQDISTLTREGLARKKAQGAKLGRPTVLSMQVKQEIKKLRESGWTLIKIADYMDDLQIPTAHGGKKWYPSTIKKLVQQQ